MKPNEQRDNTIPMTMNNKPDKILNFRGVQCPFNYVKTKLTLEEMQPQQILEVIVDQGEPARNVPKSLQEDGQKILSSHTDEEGGVHFTIHYVKEYE